MIIVTIVKETRMQLCIALRLMCSFPNDTYNPKALCDACTALYFFLAINSAQSFFLTFTFNNIKKN